jgi:hypothetical protein
MMSILDRARVAIGLVYPQELPSDHPL